MTRLASIETEDDAPCDHVHTPAAPPELASSAVVQRAAAIFRAAGDPGRLRILERLIAGERCVTELAAEFREEMSTVSQRLRLLRSERLVTRRRDGKHMYYALADSHVASLIKSALDHASEES